VVHTFPEAQDLQKEFDIKVLYGSELYLIDTEINFVFNPSERPLRGSTYCVFDLETTGLSAEYDRIIEFGAVIYENGQITKTLDLLINPEIKMSEFNMSIQLSKNNGYGLPYILLTIGTLALGALGAIYLIKRTRKEYLD
jgi:DNA polymerase-3 subunit alpha (Gram-positive type)